jgi:hypothetical protein
MSGEEIFFCVLGFLWLIYAGGTISKCIQEEKIKQKGGDTQ